MLKSNTSTKNILILMSGSIACYKVCTVISRLKQKNYNIKVVMSAAAQKFIGTATIEGLLGSAPITDMYESGSVMDHIHLARWADLILLAPATANTINKMAAGLGDDLISTIFLAHDFQKPFLLTPAMNTKMYQHPTTQKSLSELKKMGVNILETASGVLACGEFGYGRLIEPDLIMSEIESSVSDTNRALIQKDITPTQPKKILITAGGTQEPIDDVRYITNKSTGRTAARIADQLIESGFQIIYLHAENAKLPILDCRRISFNTFADLDQKLSSVLSSDQFDVVMHAAAVSDYSVVKSGIGKIDSLQENLTITLKKNPKLINQIKKISPDSLLIGFKLTSTNDTSVIQNKVQNLLTISNCDYVVHNDWSSVKTGHSIFNIYSPTTKSENLNIDDLTIEMSQIILNQERV